MPFKSKSLLLCLVLGLACGTAPVEAAAVLKTTSATAISLTPLDVDVRVAIHGAIAETTLTTTYKNQNWGDMEAEFLYSAPPGAVVTSFAYWTHGEKVLARVVEKERASQIYESFRIVNWDPGLAEMLGDNALRVRINPVPGGVDLKIEVKYVEVLPLQGADRLWSYTLGDDATGGLRNCRVRVQIDSGRGSQSNFAAKKHDIFEFKAKNYKASRPFQVRVPRSRVGWGTSVLSARETGGDGFFALTLIPSGTVRPPQIKIAGIRTYDINLPKDTTWRKGVSQLVTGRYQGSGAAVLSVGNTKIPIKFSGQRWANNPAAKLWATKRIQNLSAQGGDPKRLIDISLRFGVPSPWTSWLAIPKPEKKQYFLSRWTDELENLGTRYENAALSGDLKSSWALKTAFDKQRKKLYELGLTAEEKDSLPTLDNRLYENYSAARFGIELAKSDKEIPSAEVLRWQRQLQNLAKAGITGQGAQKSRVKKAEKAGRLAAYAELYVARLETGAGGNAGTDARSKELYKEIAKLDNYNGYGQISNARLRRGGRLAQAIVVEEGKPQPNSLLIKDLTRRLEGMGHYSWNQGGLLQQARFRVWGPRVNRVAQLLAAEIHAGRDQGVAAQRYRKQLDALEKKSHLDAQPIVDGAWAYVLNKKSFALAKEVQAHRENTPVALQMRKELVALRQRTKVEPLSYLYDAWRDRSLAVTKLYIDEALKNGENSPRAQELRKRAVELAQAGGVDFHSYVLGTLVAEQRARIAKPLAEEVLSKREDGPKARALTKEYKSYNVLFPQDEHQWRNRVWIADEELSWAWRGRVHEVANELARMRKHRPQQKQRITELEAELKRFESLIGWETRGYEEYEASVIGDGDYPLVARQYFAMRPGDPLISIRAPRDSAQVIAILPSGEIKRLIWNNLSQQWEARFDVPGYAEEGSYTIQIVVVSKDGKRHQLKMSFRVDMTAPSGNGEVKQQNGMWLLSIEAKNGLDHVDAFLPWDERVELKHVGNQFTARVAVPEEWQGKASQVRYVLTDAAHNRTEILVDMAQ